MDSNGKILVVDDDEFLRKAMVDILSPHYTVTSAESGRAAFELVRTGSFDLVLSDVCMPDGTGVELLEWIRQRDPNIPVVVFVTGYSQITVEEAIQKGAHSVISKPFGSKALLETVRLLVHPAA
jgi:CheY-like chemotaxis protein